MKHTINENVQVKPKILIVDDDITSQIVLRSILDKLGQIYIASNGVIAIDMALSIIPDIILLDINLPEKNGLLVCMELKRNPKFENVPIIFISGYDALDVEEHAFNVGAADFILKPINRHIVYARISNYLDLKLKTDNLVLLSTTDGLTKIANRRMFDITIEKEWRRACRVGATLSLLMIDIDYFKLFNDCYGHKAGDDCLCAVASTFSSTIHRADELVARYGGEEFAIILPLCTKEQAGVIANMLLNKIFNLKIPHIKNNLQYVTVSIGVANVSSVCRTKTYNNCTLENGCKLGPHDLIKSADKSLYMAKESGRNQVYLSADR